MTMDEFVNLALPVPFIEKGRDYNGWDCWGLAFCFYRDVLKIDLPEYLNYSSTRQYAELNSLINSARHLWDEVFKPLPGDLALFNLSGLPCHVGVVVDRKSVLHTEERVGTFVEPFNGVVWGKRLEGFFRCRN